MSGDGASKKAGLENLARSLKRAYATPAVTSVPLSTALLLAGPSGLRCCDGSPSCSATCTLPSSCPACCFGVPPNPPTC